MGADAPALMEETTRLGAPLGRTTGNRLVSLSADAGQRWSKERVQEAVGDRGRVENEMVAPRPEGRHLLVRGHGGGGQAVAGAAIRMVGQGTGSGLVGLLGRTLGLLMLVLVVTHVRTRCGLLVCADARSRRPGPLERQQHHEENKQQATHGRAQSSKALDGGQSCGGLMWARPLVARAPVGLSLREGLRDHSYA